MPFTNFPDPRTADEDGIVAIGGDLHPETLKAAYKKGIFPWPLPEYPEKFPHMTWFSPDPRAVLDFSDLHIPKSLRKTLRRARYQFSIDRCFGIVMEACKNAPRFDGAGATAGTWITAGMLAAYVELHEQGFAHSVEVWDGPDLVAGLYGVDAFGVFAGESMFTRVDDGSKLALLHVIERLKSRGGTWIDIQMLTPHLERLGAKLIRRDAFLDRLARSQTQAQARGRRLFEA